VLLYDARNLEEEQDALDLLLEKQVEGSSSVDLGASRQQAPAQAQSFGIPLILINRSSPVDSCDQVIWIMRVVYSTR